jgi:hypothetical protein
MRSPANGCKRVIGSRPSVTYLHALDIAAESEAAEYAWLFDCTLQKQGLHVVLKRAATDI